MDNLVNIGTPTNLNPGLCAPCGGICCKTQPGFTEPLQWGSTPEERIANLTAAFAAEPRRYAIDWWDGDP